MAASLQSISVRGKRLSQPMLSVWRTFHVASSLIPEVFMLRHQPHLVIPESFCLIEIVRGG
jgi:hypothetical protein